METKTPTNEITEKLQHVARLEEMAQDCEDREQHAKASKVRVQARELLATIKGAQYHGKSKHGQI